MTMRPLILGAIIGLTVIQSGCQLAIPPSTESLLLRCFHAKKIVSVSKVRQRTIGGNDYAGIELIAEVTTAFESVYHAAVIVRKTREAADWSQAQLFSCETLSGDQAFELSEQEFLNHLHPWPCEEER